MTDARVVKDASVNVTKMELLKMSRILSCTCHIEGCRFFGIVNQADIEQIRWHLRREHEYTELVKVAYKNNIVNSEHDFKKHEWLVRKIADLCVIREISNGS